MEEHEKKIEKLVKDPNTIMLPARRKTHTSDKHVGNKTLKLRSEKFMSVIERVEPELLSKSLSLLRDQQLASGVTEGETYLAKFLSTPLMEKFRKDAVVNTVKIIESHWTPTLEANCKVITIV